MIDKKDSAPGDAAKPGEGGGASPAGPKRPHATLDLKATDITEPTGKPGDAPKTGEGGAAKSATSATDAAASGASAAAAAAAASAADAKASSKDASTKPGEAPPSAPGAKAASMAPPPRGTAPLTPPPASGARVASALSHTLAGLVGGGLVLLASHWTGTETTPNSLDEASRNVRIQEMEDRLAAIEKAGAGAPAVAQKLAEAESRIANVEEIGGAVTALNDAQNKLAGDLTALAERLAREGVDPADRERLAKLEQRLDLIASADTGGDANRLPQLAAITGKIADLEQALSSQLAALRAGIPSEIDRRVEAIAAGAEAAKAGTQRIDRDLGAVRTDAARVGQQVEATQAEIERLTAAVDAVKEETGKLTATMGEVRKIVDDALKTAARPADVAKAVAPVTERTAAVEQRLDGILKGEESRRANAQRIVLALELANLKRVLDRGLPYAAELVEVRRAAAGAIELGALDRYAVEGVPTQSDLEREFRPLMFAAIDADGEPAEGSVVDRLLAGAKSVIRVRRVSHDADDKGVEAVTGRMETALREGRLDDVLREAGDLSPQAAAPMRDWLDRVAARNAVDQALADIDQALKASLSGAGAPPAADAEKPADKPR